MIKQEGCVDLVIIVLQEVKRHLAQQEPMNLDQDLENVKAALLGIYVQLVRPDHLHALRDITVK